MSAETECSAQNRMGCFGVFAEGTGKREYFLSLWKESGRGPEQLLTFKKECLLADSECTFSKSRHHRRKRNSSHLILSVPCVYASMDYCRFLVPTAL